jgi:hypothetical protein
MSGRDSSGQTTASVGTSIVSPRPPPATRRHAGHIIPLPALQPTASLHDFAVPLGAIPIQSEDRLRSDHFTFACTGTSAYRKNSLPVRGLTAAEFAFMLNLTTFRYGSRPGPVKGVSRIGELYHEIKDRGAPPCCHFRRSVGIGEHIDWVRIIGSECQNRKHAYVGEGYRSARRARPGLFHRDGPHRPVAVGCLLEQACDGTPGLRRHQAQPRGHERKRTGSRRVQSYL